MKIEVGVVLRPSVEWWSQSMEKRLREKDPEKGTNGWHDKKLPYYIERAMVCLYTVTQTLKTGKDTEEYIGIEFPEKLSNETLHFLTKKCLDGSNFLMMLADNLRDELVKRGISQNGR